MKRNRKLAIVSNVCLAAVVFAVACVCLYPVGVSTSGGSGRILTEGDRGGAQISLLLSVYEGEEYIPPILDVLDEYGAKATFFVGGSWADDNADCVRRIAQAGHEIGSHGYFHRDHKALDYAANYTEIKQSVDFLARVCRQPVLLFAPPSGSYGEQTLRAAGALGLKTVMWSKDTIDWRDKDEELCYRRATESVAAGDLILMHPMPHTLAALPRILERYKALGLGVVPVGENIA